MGQRKKSKKKMEREREGEDQVLTGVGLGQRLISVGRLRMEAGLRRLRRDGLARWRDRWGWARSTARLLGW